MLKNQTMVALSLYNINSIVSLAELNKDAIAEFWNKEKVETLITLLQEYKEVMVAEIGEDFMKKCSSPLFSIL